MSSDLSVDRDSLQKVLASVFEVQASGISRESLVDVMDIQRSMSADDFDQKRIFDMVVHHARRVAKADGIAVALLEANQLIYRAGSGRACSYVGRQLTAVLASDSSRERREILRVENADVDIRIEAAICRQFDVKSLLILSIFEDRRVAGVFEVFFSHAHIFEDGETRAYRLLAGLIEDALLRGRQLVVERMQPTDPTAALRREQPAFHVQPILCESAGQSSKPGVGLGLGGERPVHREVHMSTTATAQVKQVVAQQPPAWKSFAATIALAAIVSSWLIYDTSRMLPSVSVASRPDRPDQSVPTSAFRQQQFQRKPRPTVSRTQRLNSAFKRKRVGPNEVDYVADDVTIRNFAIASPRRSQPVDRGTQFNIGTDVTVHYFSKNSVSSPEPKTDRPATSATNSFSR